MNPWILNTWDFERIMISWVKGLFDYPHVFVDPDRQSFWNSPCNKAGKPLMTIFFV